VNDHVGELVERNDGFAYDYRMKCDCGGSSVLTAADYFAEVNQAHMQCEHCGGTIHFGRAVIALRDEHDPALENERISQLVWYHTSTSEDWPSATHADRASAQFQGLADRLGDRLQAFIERESTKALHVGTYEAAVENMLRRMHDQADVRSQFHLHRVTLEVDPARINQGYRDENDQEAAQLGVADLDVAGVDVIRYLNVYEAAGTLSLAVHPRVVRTVQTVALPVQQLAEPLPPALDTRSAVWESRRAALEEEAIAWSRIDPRHLNLIRLGLRPDPDGIRERSEAAMDRGWELWREIKEGLVEHLLPGVSPMVARDFVDALDHWRAHGDVELSVPTYARHFANHAVAMTRAPEVVALLASQPTRRISAQST